MIRSARPMWVLLATGLLAGTAACNPPAEVVPASELRVRRPGAQPSAGPGPRLPGPGASTLVLVYSRSGHTARAARAVAEELGADLWRVQGRGGEGDSLWRTPSSGSLVEVHPGSVDFSAYRSVIVATPIWYWRPTALARSVVARSAVSGKRMVLLYTFEGGVSEGALATWAGQLRSRGGQVVDVLGIDRRRLKAAGALEAHARQLARQRRTLWTGP